MNEILCNFLESEKIIIDRYVWQLFSVCKVEKVISLIKAKSKKVLRAEDLTLKDVLFLMEYEKDL